MMHKIGKLRIPIVGLIGGVLSAACSFIMTGAGNGTLVFAEILSAPISLPVSVLGWEPIASKLRPVESVLETCSLLMLLSIPLVWFCAFLIATTTNTVLRQLRLKVFFILHYSGFLVVLLTSSWHDWNTIFIHWDWGLLSLIIAYLFVSYLAAQLWLWFRYFKKE